MLINSRLKKIESLLKPTNEILMKVLIGATPQELATMDYEDLKTKYQDQELSNNEWDNRFLASIKLFQTKKCEAREKYTRQFKFVTLHEMTSVLDY